MPDIFTSLQTVSSVKNRVVALEESGPLVSTRARNDSQGKEDQPLIEITSERKKTSVDSHSGKVSTSKSNPADDGSYRKGHKRLDSTAFLKQTYLTVTPTKDLSDDAREILRSQPGQEDLLAVLQYLQCGIERKHDFNIRAPSAKGSQITNALVNATVVDHWYRLKQKRLSHDDRQLKRALVSCLSSVTGVGALLAQGKKLAPKNATGGENALKHDMISVLEQILSPSSTIYDFIQNTLSVSDKPTQRHVVWQEFISLLAGGKILTVVAQASRAGEVDVEEGSTISWLGNGPKYCNWLARSIAHAANALFVKETEAWSMLAQITKRGFSLGNRDSFVAEIYSSLLLGHKSSWTAMHELLRALPRWEQKAFFDAMMRDIARNHMGSDINSLGFSSSPVTQDRSIEAVAGLVAGITQNNQFLHDYIVEWLVDDTGDNASICLHARRAVMATLANHEEKLQRILERCLELLSDKLQIQHAPIMAQEATMQTTLLAVAYLNRLNHNAVKDISRSSSYIHAVSNRLGSSMPRARYLGMLVGVAISRIVDEPGKAMDFGAEEMDSEEGKAWLGLVNVNDRIGKIEDLHKIKDLHRLEGTVQSAMKPAASQKKKKPSPHKPATSKIISITELSSSDSDTPTLTPYPTPDSDPSDSDSDPTLLTRTKPKPPVYIHQLISSLTSSDPPTISLALRTAPSLIRRKATFGTELSSNLDTLASTLLSLSEGLSKPLAQTHRLNALIALIIAAPARMGPWLSAMYFEGDLSLVQRATLLTAIGLGCRELAGYSSVDGYSNAKEEDRPNFPSKTLPPSLSAMYAPLTALTNNISSSTLQPLALTALEESESSGPKIFQTRTISSRLTKSRLNPPPSDTRTTPPKNLHHLLTTSFLLPLLTRLKHLLTTSSSSPLLSSHPLSLLLQTLLLLLHTLGPNTPTLSLLTSETLTLLLSLHNSPLALSPPVLPVMLSLLLTLLTLNTHTSTSESRLITDFGSQITELISWISSLSTSSHIPTLSDDESSMPWTAIAAGCQVKWQEVGRKFQGRMLGLRSGELDGFEY